MIKIDTIGVWGFEGSLKGMRNPRESRAKSDSVFYPCDFREGECDSCRFRSIPCNIIQVKIGPEDITLCKKLIKAGSEHRKFLRMIHVQADVTAPRYWWAEMDKYKFVEANSSSTMHLITKRELTIKDFSLDDGFLEDGILEIIFTLNNSIHCYNESTDEGMKRSWFRTIKQLLPESYNQLRTIDTNYECLLSIYHQRHAHRLSEWREFCDWIEGLPYMDEFLKECTFIDGSPCGRLVED